jgi:hypothetical protein
LMAAMTIETFLNSLMPFFSYIPGKSIDFDK